MPAKKSAAASAKSSQKKTSYSPLTTPDIFVSSAKGAVPVYFLRDKELAAWLKGQSSSIKTAVTAHDWSAKPNSVLVARAPDGTLEAVCAGISETIGFYTAAAIVDTLQRSVPDAALKKTVFTFEPEGLSTADLTAAGLGWAMGCYQFTAFKKSNKTTPKLALPKQADSARIQALAEAVFLARNLINLPANALGPAELADAARAVAAAKKATIKITEDQKLVSSNFPLIYGVGDSSDRRPCLIDMAWGKATDPKVTIVGKGVCFDTGGLDIKPSSAMLTMKKDMGGAAMALGIFWVVAALKLPIRLRVLIPAVENSISGRAYRPMDILNSRKGLTVEIGNTDAEGRLAMADCLTLASEEKPDLLIDISTLTGAARAALGMDIPALFSNRDSLAQQLQAVSLKVEDPVWQLPLYQPYRPDIVSPVADLSNSGNNVAGAITAALFLESFVEKGIDWMHIDCSAWEASGRPGRPRGGADTSLRAVFSFLEDRYASKKKKKA